MRYLDAQDAAHLYSSCGLMKGALVDFNCREMHLIWWLLCQVENIVCRYNLVIARHAGALQGLLLGMYEDVVHWELENVAELQGLYREYQEVVEWIPIHIEDRIRYVHDCGMVFQVLLDFDEGDVVADFSAGERPLFFPFVAYDCFLSAPCSDQAVFWNKVFVVADARERCATRITDLVSRHVQQ